MIEIFVRYKRLAIGDIVANWDEICPRFLGIMPLPDEKKILSILQSLEKKGIIKFDQRRSIDLGEQEYVFLRHGNIVSLEFKMMGG
jgi:hypothetical protein